MRQDFYRNFFSAGRGYIPAQHFSCYYIDIFKMAIYIFCLFVYSKP